MSNAVYFGAKSRLQNLRHCTSLCRLTLYVVVVAGLVVLLIPEVPLRETLTEVEADLEEVATTFIPGPAHV